MDIFNFQLNLLEGILFVGWIVVIPFTLKHLNVQENQSLLAYYSKVLDKALKLLNS